MVAGILARAAGLLLLLGATASAGDVASAAQRGFSHDEARAMPPATLAQRVLGRTRTAAIDKVEVGWSFFGGFDAVTLMERAVPGGARLCGRQLHRAEMRPVNRAASSQNRQARMRVGTIDSYRVLGIVGMDGACPTWSRSYLPVTADNEADRAAILRSLAEARAAAAGPGRLPFRINCRLRDALEIWCRDEGRPSLAMLTFEELGGLRSVWTNDCERTVFEYEGGPCPTQPAGAPVLLGWEIMLPNSAADRTWMIGIGAGARADTIEMEPHYIIFH